VSGLASETALAQKRITRKKAATAAAPPPPDMRPHASEVAEQIRLLSRFLFVYGKVANGLEVAREQAARKQTSPAIEARNRQTREGLVAGIDRLAGSIENLTESFKDDPQMQIQYLRIAGARDAVSEAADLANRQLYEEAGQSLVTAIERLTETIISMKLN
ncbi:MAG: hypothetical protein ACKOB4_15620, partial [Acidobacteriota bacterium]